MNAFIYDEKGTLFVRKPNGLEYDYTTVDKPAFDFDFDVIIYDDIEVKIVNWEDGLSFDQQAKTALSNEEKDMIEQYIENSEPPMGHSLNSQFINNLYKPRITLTKNANNITLIVLQKLFMLEEKVHHIHLETMPEEQWNMLTQ
jgi:hypothetical protein